MQTDSQHAHKMVYIISFQPGLK